MARCPPLAGEVALIFIDKIPVIGIRYKNRRQAKQVAKKYMEDINNSFNSKSDKIKIVFKRQTDGRYCLEITHNKQPITYLENIDELLLKRFKKSLFIKNLFILTCFVERKNGELECLVLTEGLGTVVYSPKNRF